MTLVKDIRKTVTDTNPVFAAVGVTDLAIEKLRDARARGELTPSALQDKAVKGIEKVTEQVQQIPADVRSQSVEAADKAQQTYADLAVRGHKLVTRLRNQKSTQDLIAQAGSTVSLGKGAVTTVRHAATETERSPGTPSLIVTTRRRFTPHGMSFSCLHAVTQPLHSMQRSASQRNFIRAMVQASR